MMILQARLANPAMDILPVLTSIATARPRVPQIQLSHRRTQHRNGATLHQAHAVHVTIWVLMLVVGARQCHRAVTMRISSIITALVPVLPTVRCVIMWRVPALCVIRMDQSIPTEILIQGTQQIMSINESMLTSWARSPAGPLPIQETGHRGQRMVLALTYIVILTAHQYRPARYLLTRHRRGELQGPSPAMLATVCLLPIQMHLRKLTAM